MMKKKKEDQAAEDGDDEGFESSPEKVSSYGKSEPCFTAQNYC